MTPRELQEMFSDGQLRDAKQQMQKVLTSIFMSENSIRQGVLDGVLDSSRMSEADRLFSLRKQLAAIVQQQLGDTPCIPQQNKILYNK
jgi:hypothetical protein